MARRTGPGEVAEPIAPEAPGDPVALAALAAHEEVVEFTFGPADLAGADLTPVRLVRGEVRDVAFTGARLRGATFVDVTFRDCEFSGADLHGATLTRVEFANCRMVGLNASEAEFAHVRIADCKLDDANLRFAHLDHVWVDSSSLRELDAMEASLTQVRFATCDLTGADLAKVTVAGFDLRGSTIEGLGGAAALRGVRIGVDQVIPYATSVFAETGIRID